MIRILIFTVLAIFIVIAGLVFILNQKFKNPITTPLTEDNLMRVTKECQKQPKFAQEGFQGLLTDVHVHTMPASGHIEAALGLLQAMNQNGIDRAVVQAGHMPLGKASITSQLDQIWGQISSVCPRIITLLYGFNPDESDAWKYVERQLNTGNFGGVGEIEFQHSNLPIKHDLESESMMKIYELLNSQGLALHFQADLRREPSLGPKLVKIIKNYPKINFVWFGGCRLDGDFSNLPNLYCDIFLHSQSREMQEEVLKKSLIGSDASPPGVQNPGYQFLPYKSVGEAAAQARAKLQTLPKDLADTLAHGNFDRIWSR